MMLGAETENIASSGSGYAIVSSSSSVRSTSESGVDLRLRMGARESLSEYGWATCIESFRKRGACASRRGMHRRLTRENISAA